ncbi:alpha/beta fold hydrolase [Flagellimonas meridianipacifica]|uniref:Putative alpha/beta hydrolase n=1 Tax=Flagellimonas meridianipacifica TaxID=1080225 RepID=A0A2T0M8A5_9FLAO|nr:alpha/beta fold hydrolase [Allomuricauda pacifica]PRX53766.1 putative alpha/beta hydrolase [Allomuricauda pacifica]
MAQFQEKEIQCEDGFVLKARLFSPEKDKKGKILIINSATAVGQNLYANYAQFMAENGFHVLTYDYRGIAESRPKKLRGFYTSFTDWGEKDVSSVLVYAKENFPNFPINILGHSIGGTLIGMTPRSDLIDKAMTIGAQTAFYKDWGKGRLKLYFLWHLVFPLVTDLVGYFPGKKLGLLEDVPKGVVQQWHARRKNPSMIKQLESKGINTYFAKYKRDLLTLAISDDPIGTEPALKRIHVLFENAHRTWETVRPIDINEKEIGHFGFFRRKFKETLWTKTLIWFENH